MENIEKDGLTMATAIDVDSGKDINNFISIWLMEKYGGDEDWFTNADRFIDDPKTKIRYKVLDLELNDGKYVQHWFRIV